MHIKCLSIFILFIFVSCAKDAVSEDVQLSDYSVMDNNEVDIEYPPSVIPPNGEYALLSLQPETNWETLDDYYRTVILENRDLSYFDNLQWSCISEMVQDEHFLEEAPIAVKKFYLGEVFARSYINEPKVVLMLIRGAGRDLSSGELMFYGRTVREKNKAFLTTENFESHVTRNVDYYAMLDWMGGI